MAAEFKGKKEQNSRGLEIYTLKSTTGVTIVAKNNSETRKRFNLDMKSSQNVDFAVKSG